jgi:hypothetical protein
MCQNLALWKLADFIFSTILEAFLDSFLEDEIKGKKIQSNFYKLF